MKQLTVNQLADVIKAEPLFPGDDRRTAAVSGVSTDSRTISNGDCFFAIAGDNFDGHKFVKDAFDKGAVCAVVCGNFQPQMQLEKPVLKVPDTVIALGELARFYRNAQRFKVIAITGSVGKTTARQIIHHVLSSRFKTHQSPKNYNNQIGLPLTLLAAPPDTEIVVAELGTNKVGEISYLAKIASPDIALITNIYPAHLEGFGSIEEIAKEKISIAEGLKAAGMLIINTDFPLLKNFCDERKISPLTFGLSVPAQIRAENIVCSGLKSSFTIEGTAVELPLAGQANIVNALAAWAVCRQFNIKIEDFARALRTVKPADMRAQILQIGTLTVINDCYNANPASMVNALQMLSALNTDGSRRPVFICGDMNELGKEAEILHQQLGKQIAQSNIQLLITVGPLTKITAQTAKQIANHNIQIICVPDSHIACNILKNFIKDSDIVLVKGSRAARLEITIEKLKELFVSEVSAPAGR